MINKIRIERFKKFEDVEVEIGRDPVLFVGQNNGGKTTALQALSLWSLLINRWQLEKKGTKATQRKGLPISRNTVTAVPVQDIRMLWNNGEVQDTESKRFKIVITVYGKDRMGKSWEYGIEATYANKEMLYCGPLNVDAPIPEEVKKVFHLPPLSGVQTIEKKLDEGAQMQAIGEGRPGEILRNLLLQVQNDSPEKWQTLKSKIQSLFNIELLDISYNPQVDPSITVNYRPLNKNKKSKIDFEIANSGSGFLQFLLLASFMYAHENGAVLLIDEPDSHMHSFLQSNTYDWLLELAHETNSQLIISTHAEVLINRTEDLSQIRTFFGERPKKIEISDRNKLQKVLEEASPVSIVNAEMSQKIFFAEGDTDLRILKAFANVLSHPVLAKFESPDFFFRPYNTNDIKDAMKYFSSLREIIEPNLKAFCLRDYIAIENRTKKQDLPENFMVEYWEKPEIENYLIHPNVLLRFVEKMNFGGLFQKDAEIYLQGKLPPDFYKNPLVEDIGEKGSDFLDKFFKHIKLDIKKGRFWQIAEVFEADEVHNDIKNMLDRVMQFL